MKWSFKMWIAIDIEEHMWQRNLAETLANYMNQYHITKIYILNHTDKTISAVGWIEQQGAPE